MQNRPCGLQCDECLTRLIYIYIYKSCTKVINKLNFKLMLFISESCTNVEVKILLAICANDSMQKKNCFVLGYTAAIAIN